MKIYFMRLSNHPGVPIATMLSMIAIIAGMTNENMGIITGAIFGFAVSLPFWAIVLITAISQPLPKEKTK